MCSTLDTARVKHHTHALSHGVGRKVGSELGTYHTSVSMWASDAAPDDTDLLAVLCLGYLIHKCDTLSEVKVCVFSAVHALHLDERGVAILVGVATSVSDKVSSGVQSDLAFSLV